MLEKTIIRRLVRDNTNEQTAFSNPVLTRIINQRKCQYTSYALSDLERPDNLTNIDKVTDKLLEIRENGSHMLIIGDYDCDGATATTVAIQGLQELGFKNVNYLIPNRFETGYGLNTEIIKQALQSGTKPNTIMTVDNGISSIDGVSFAKSHNIDVIITDHHLPGEKLPETEFIINPQLKDDTFASKAICGVGVMFYLLIALRKKLKERGLIQENVNLMKLIDLVTLGTIADCVPLDKNNRTLIHHGLKNIRNNKMSKGIRALIEESNINIKTITSIDIAFRVAPKLNAVGRMSDMSMGVRCLLSTSDHDAQKHVKQLTGFNTSRSELQLSIQNQALDQIKRHDKECKKVIVLFHEDWHQGVIGIVASRIKDLVHKPCIIFASDENEYIKGSGRSIEGIHIKDVLENIATKHGILDKFGGHAMAAGLRIKKDDLDVFEKAINAEVNDYPDSLFKAIQYSDGELASSEISIQTAEALENYGIWGQDYPEPVFENVLKVLDKKILKGKHLKLTLQYEGKQYKAMWFFCSETLFETIVTGESYRFFYKLSVSVYLGEKQLSLFIEHFNT